MDLHPEDFPHIILDLKKLAEKEGFSKIFAKIPAHFAPSFLGEGYMMEAFVPKFFNGQEDLFFLMYYLDKQRQQPEHMELGAFQKLFFHTTNYNLQPLGKEYLLQKLSPEDAIKMADVFCHVFETYPFPIFDTDFLIKSMKQDETRYFGIWLNNDLIAISSAECDKKNKNAEMTDFAVLPKHRGQRLAIHLLDYMEKLLREDGYKTFYTIARLHSTSMNKTFYNLGYRYSGTLHNNTQISGKIESMNIWYKNV